MAVLAALDAHRTARRIVARGVFRIGVSLLGLMFVVMIFSSIQALRQVNRSVESLIGDSLIGLEASVAMRATVRETQLDLLRYKMSPDRLSESKIDAFKGRMAAQLRDYRTGALDSADKLNALRIEERLDAYLEALRPISGSLAPESSIIMLADGAARDLVNAVEEAYQFNLRRVHASADEAAGAARQALLVSNWLWWSLGAFAAVALLAYLAFRWLPVPGDGEN